MTTSSNDDRETVPLREGASYNGLSFSEAVEMAREGWCICRDKWAKEGAYAFWAVSGSFIAFDKTTGKLEPCLIVTARGLNIPFLANDADKDASDWIAITRAQAQR